MTVHEDWVRQINAELDGELSLKESAALARHLVTCGACASARVSQLELRVALAPATGHAGKRHSSAHSRGAVRAHRAVAWVLLSIVVASAAGWLAHARWGGPLRGSVESSRAAFVVQ